MVVLHRTITKSCGDSMSTLVGRDPNSRLKRATSSSQNEAGKTFVLMNPWGNSWMMSARDRSSA